MTEYCEAVKAVLFDFDMTLVDSSYAIHTCVNLFADEMGFRRVSREEVLRAIGMTMEDSWRGYWGDFRQEWLDKYRAMFRGQEQSMLRLFPNAVSAVKELRAYGIKVGVVSNRRFARKPIEYLGIMDIFDIVIGLEDVVHAKPHPEPLLTALERLGTERRASLYVGDTDIDMKTAAAAGVRGVGMATGNFSAPQLAAAGAWRTCQDLSELPALCLPAEREPR